MVNTHTISVDDVKRVLLRVMDPEVPVLSILDLGIVRDIKIENQVHETPGKYSVQTHGKIIITITPTYSGCPAMDVIRMNIRIAVIEGLGIQPGDFEIRTILSPAWTTDWMTEEGKQKLKAYGIAPPNHSAAVCTPDLFAEEEAVQCPRCNSYNTTMISRFGSTACKALYRCEDCREPFDHFKCH